MYNNLQKHTKHYRTYNIIQKLAKQITKTYQKLTKPSKDIQTHTYANIQGFNKQKRSIA